MVYAWLLGRAPTWGVAALLFLSGMGVAIWSSGVAAKAMRKKDPRCVVIDELAAVPLALAGLGPVSWKWAAAFVVFRVLDVWKPFPLRRWERWEGGWGIVADDLGAALGACGIVHRAAAVLGR